MTDPVSGKNAAKAPEAPSSSSAAQRLQDIPEFWALWLGVGLGLICLFTVLFCSAFNPALGKVLLKVVTSHFVLGAPMGAVEGAKHVKCLSFLQNVVFNSALTACIICLFNAVFGLSCRKVFHLPFLQKRFHSIQSDAKRQKKAWARFGVPGIFVFVFIPIPMTGPVVGSLLARFVGLRLWGSVATVVTASIASIAAWGYAADRIQQYLGSRVLQVFLWMLILLTLGIAALAKLRHFVLWLRGQKAETTQESEENPSMEFPEFAEGEGNTGSSSEKEEESR